jgi:chromate transport protein ChrA
MTTRDRDNGCWDPRYFAIALGAALVVIVAALLSKRFPVGSSARIALALVEGAATAFVILMPWRMMRRLDELQQRVQLEALAAAFFIVGVGAAVYGFLEGAGLPKFDWGAWLWPLMVFVWGAAQIVARRRYR